MLWLLILRSSSHPLNLSKNETAFGPRVLNIPEQDWENRCVEHKQNAPRSASRKRLLEVSPTIQRNNSKSRNSKKKEEKTSPFLQSNTGIISPFPSCNTCLQETESCMPDYTGVDSDGNALTTTPLQNSHFHANEHDYTASSFIAIFHQDSHRVVLSILHNMTM